MTHDSSDSPFVQFPLTKGYIAIISPEDADITDLKFNWRVLQGAHSQTVYAYGSKRVAPNRFHVFLHRLIIERVIGRALAKGEVVDHINGDALDNRRSNLRVADYSQNHCNSPRPRHNKSGYKGVSWDKKSKKWRAYITLHGKQQHLGFFSDVKDAARAYNAVAPKYHGEFAYINPIPE